jgi:hypothetical protein
VARTEQVTSGLVVKQKEQGSSVTLPNKSINPEQLSDSVAFGLIPIGAVIPIMAHLSGSFLPGASGTVVNGLMLCDGAAIPSGNTLTGVTPNLSNDAYLRGSASAGTTGGANAKTLNSPQLPSHTHPLTIANDNISHDHPGSTGIADAPHAHPATSSTENAPHNHPASIGGVNAPHAHPLSGDFLSYTGGVPSGANNYASGNQSFRRASSTNAANAPHGHPVTVNANNAPHSHTITVTANNAPHSHPVTISSVNVPHSHPGSSIGTTGAGDSINFEPNYVSCVYVIRVR